MAEVIPTNKVHFEGEARTLAQLAQAVERQLAAEAKAGTPLAIASSDPLQLIGMAAWLAKTETDGLLLPHERLIPAVRQTLLQRGWRILDLAQATVEKPDRPAAAKRGRVMLLTSGTTGVPKMIEHTWTTLFTMARVREARPLNWLVSYQGGTYAWYQLVTLGLFLAGQQLTVARDRYPSTLIAAALSHGVTAISATPTFWRMVLLQSAPETLRRVPLQQITLGGERVDQNILDRVHELYPHAAVAHIYASTETGACLVVRDGKEGFPAAWLRQESTDGGGSRPMFDIRDNALWVRSPHAAVNQPEWVNTGDAVEVRGDRVIILGRIGSAIINVGGSKAAASDVERQVLEHPAVLWCHVSGRRAPLVGELVVCDVVFRSPAEAVPESELVAFCAQRMPDYMIPRLWNRLDSIPVTGNLKTALRS